MSIGKSNLISNQGSGSSGTSTHNDLTGRDAANQHPISAIENLHETLVTKQNRPEIITGFTISKDSWSLLDGVYQYVKAVAGIENLQNLRPVVYFDITTQLNANVLLAVETTETTLVFYTKTAPLIDLVVNSVYFNGGGF